MCTLILCNGQVTDTFFYILNYSIFFPFIMPGQIFFMFYFENAFISMLRIPTSTLCFFCVCVWFFFYFLLTSYGTRRWFCTYYVVPILRWRSRSWRTETLRRRLLWCGVIFFRNRGSTCCQATASSVQNPGHELQNAVNPGQPLPIV